MKYYIEVLKKYADFNGRARRKEFWMFTLFSMIFTYTLMFVDLYFEIGFLNTVYAIAVFVPTAAVWIRRMHDVGKSGWYCLIPIYNLVLACTDSENGSNEYGENPKNIGDEINEIGIPQE